MKRLFWWWVMDERWKYVSWDGNVRGHGWADIAFCGLVVACIYLFFWLFGEGV